MRTKPTEPMAQAALASSGLPLAALPAIASLRLTQNFAANLGVKKELATVPVRKPGAQVFVRVHPDESYRLETMVLELKEDREIYLVGPELWGELSGELSPRVLYTTINRQSVIALWPIRLPGADGRIDNWSASAHQAAAKAQTAWVRVASNMSLGAYDIYEAPGSIPEPEWPTESFETLLQVAFRDRYIQSLDHVVVRRLRGLQ